MTSSLLFDAPAPLAAPSLRQLLGEAATPLEAVRLARALPALATAPRASADAPVVLLIPGYMTPEVTMAPLRLYLRFLGYDARPYGMGGVTSDVISKVRRFTPVVDAVAETSGRPVALIGWSLGGLVARETARDTPDAVSQVMTIGTPVIGGPMWTNARVGYTSAAIHAYARLADSRARNPLPRPVTSMVSRRDGIVAWEAQLDHVSDTTEHVEIRSTHLGMGLDPDVWLTTARALHAGASAATTARETEQDERVAA